MASITCPNCGKLIEVDPSSVEDLTRQLRDDLFEHDLAQRLAEMGHTHEAQLEVVREQERRSAEKRVASVQQRADQLQAQLDLAGQQQELAVERARATLGQELAQLKTQLETAEREAQLAVERERAAAGQREAELRLQLDQEKAQLQAQATQAGEQARQREAELAQKLAGLEERLAAQEQTLTAQAQTQLVKATSELEQRADRLEAQLQVERANADQAQASLREEMARRESELAQRTEERLAAKDEQISQREQEIERLRDYRMRLSTKLIGESLERHCEAEFNKIRLQAYPHATFEKDNLAVDGTKGDFIFRDYDDEGNELLSIMFEMKNEEEQSASASRKRNEDHFKKLDADRTKKGCEFAVLVSTLEPDSELYNAGIVDVSWHYPKMFVVRPQCFTAIIGLLKAAALAAQPYRLQLERQRQEQLDVSKFEERVADLVGGIARDYTLAAKNYDQAAKDIDAIIAKLEHLKGQLGTAAKHFGVASKRGDKLSVKRLTRGNPTMKEAFAQAAHEHPHDEPAQEVSEEPVLDELDVEDIEEAELE